MFATCLNNGNKGFTLLEVLIAVALLGILATALYSSYFGLITARDKTVSGMESRRELGATLDLIRREVASAVYSRSDKKLRFIVEDRDNFGLPASSLELTTLTPPFQDNRGESGVINTVYRLAEKPPKRMLTRQEKDSFSQEKTVAAYPQMEHIHSFLIECYDGSKWVKSWDTSINGMLPKTVRVTIQVLEDGKPIAFSSTSSPMVTAQ